MLLSLRQRLSVRKFHFLECRTVNEDGNSFRHTCHVLNITMEWFSLVVQDAMGWKLGTGKVFLAEVYAFVCVFRSDPRIFKLL
jgi:hypothetical protein